MSISKMQVGIIGPSRQDGLERAAQETMPIKRSKAEKQAPSKTQETSPQDSVSVSDVWRRVARDIDVKDATPREIIALSRQLYEANAISYDDHINLSFQPEMNLDSPSESKPFSHERRDYIAFWQSKEENVIRFGGDRQQIEETHRIQSLLVYLDSLS